MENYSSISSESDKEQSTTSTKKRKRHYDMKYSDSWEHDKKYCGWLKRSVKGCNFFFCKICKIDLKCGAGTRVLDNHVNCTKHKNNERSMYFVSVVFEFVMSVS